MHFRVVLRVMKEEGLSGLWVRVKKKVVATIDLYQIDLDEMNQEMDDGKQTDFVLTPMTQTLFKRMVDAYGTEIPPEKKIMLWKRLDEKSTERVYLLVEKEDGSILGFYCISYGDNVDVETKYVVKAAKGNAFLFDAYTFIPHRRRGAQKRATIELLKLLQQKGLETATVMIYSANLYSKKATLKYGFYKIAEVTHVNLRVWKGNFERKYARNDR